MLSHVIPLVQRCTKSFCIQRPASPLVRTQYQPSSVTEVADRNGAGFSIIIAAATWEEDLPGHVEHHMTWARTKGPSDLHWPQNRNKNRLPRGY